MTYPENEYSVPEMTVEAATDYAGKVHRFVERDADLCGLGGDEAIEFAYDRFERMYGIGRWTVEHLRKGKAKTCDIGVFAKLKAAYLDLCERQVRKLQMEIAVEKARGDDTNTDLADRLDEIAQAIAERKGKAA